MVALIAQMGGCARPQPVNPPIPPAPSLSLPSKGSDQLEAYDPNIIRQPVSETWSFTNGRWVCVTDNASFSIRDTAEDAVFQGKMWISNAYYYGHVLTRDLWNSSDGLTWIKVLDETPYDGYSELVVYNDKLWAIKGSVWNSPDGVNWTQIHENTPFGSNYSLVPGD